MFLTLLYLHHIVNATSLVTHKGKYATVSTDAAKFLSGWMSDTNTPIIDGTDKFDQYAAELEGIKQWSPSRLYIFTDKSSTKVVYLFDSMDIA